MTNKGWQCPVCEAVYSPSYPKCDNCKPKPYKKHILTREQYHAMKKVFNQEEIDNILG